MIEAESWAASVSKEELGIMNPLYKTRYYDILADEAHSWLVKHQDEYNYIYTEGVM